MDRLIRLGAGAGILALIICAILVFRSPAPTQTQVVTNPDGSQTQTQTYGSVTGPDSYFQRETHNGIAYEFNRNSLAVGTTTSCAIKTPAATSTITEASVYIKTNQASESVNITTGNAMQASTTALSGTFTTAAGAQGVIVASTTNTETTRLLSPSTWVQFNIFGGSGVASSTGTCQATFTVI